MEKKEILFDEIEVLHTLKHYLPAQAPLKDFIHHNTLHAFQYQKFHDGLRTASGIFGYKTSLGLDEFRRLFESGRIREDVLLRVLEEQKGKAAVSEWKSKLLSKKYNLTTESRVGKMRNDWERIYGIDLDVLVYPTLFRIVSSYLDQGISIWNFPVGNMGFLNCIREIEKHSYATIFKSRRAKALLNSRCKISELLKIVVGDPARYTHYLFDQQFGHQGWSGMVSAIEDHPASLLDSKKISLKDFILLELLLEIDVLDRKFGEIWSPIGYKTQLPSGDLFEEVVESEYNTVLSLWQDAYEWSYYDEALAALVQKGKNTEFTGQKTFQALFCIDDREISLRDHLEKTDAGCETFGTPGFFGVEFYFQPEHGKSYTKQCPAPVNPSFLIKEMGISAGRKKDLHLAKHSHSLFKGWIMAPTLGFWSAFRLFLSIFRPSMSPATATSFNHMDKYSSLSILHDEKQSNENALQIGYTIEEMLVRVEALLRSIGLLNNFAPLIYLFSHGSTSANNPHYAAYNCGACSGRPGSVNARVFSFMANHTEVRRRLELKGIKISDDTHFLGALHDTTRDEVVYYDEESIPAELFDLHKRNRLTILKALELNSKERARRFELVNLNVSAKKIHQKILTRSVSLFEPRPELNHATNALCLVGRRELSRNIFLDRRAFANSYDYRTDPDGAILLNVMKPLGPVCGGINLEYFFSRVDNEKLGAGTKLPHNVMGLIGVANGFDGDLRPGLPSQMIEVHDPIRLLIIVEHFPDVVLRVIQSDPSVYEWYQNEWIHLVALEPETKKLYTFKNNAFSSYIPLKRETEKISDLSSHFETRRDNLPVFELD